MTEAKFSMTSPTTSSVAAPRVSWKPIAVGVALLALVIGSAYASVPLPYSPVPMTLQSLAVLMVGIWGGARMGAAVLVSYLVLGVIGLPVFAGGQAAPGLAFFLRPTAGFLIAFVPAAFVAGWCMSRMASRFAGAFVAMSLGHVVIFAGGVSWLAAFLGFERAIAVAFMPFILGTLVKIALGVALALALRPPRAWRA